MSISNVSSDYTGRTKDINIFGYKNPLTQTVSTAAMSFGATSSYCTGVQKLMQRYTIMFLTNLGSQPNYPTFGTDFVTTVSSTQSGADMTHVYVFANKLVIDAFREYQQVTKNLPTDEQLQTVLLKSISYDSGVLNLAITFLTSAGDTVDYILPLPQVP